MFKYFFDSIQTCAYRIFLQFWLWKIFQIENLHKYLCVYIKRLFKSYNIVCILDVLNREKMIQHVGIYNFARGKKGGKEVMKYHGVFMAVNRGKVIRVIWKGEMNAALFHFIFK